MPTDINVLTTPCPKCGNRDAQEIQLYHPEQRLIIGIFCENCGVIDRREPLVTDDECLVFGASLTDETQRCPDCGCPKMTQRGSEPWKCANCDKPVLSEEST